MVLEAGDSMDRKLVDFFHTLDRALFIDNENKAFASLDSPLPIGFGQTISQPSLVVMMTNWLELEAHSRVLEIGTGSGYQTAFLARFSSQVYTIECIPELAATARSRLEILGYANIQYKIGDGSAGWMEHAPYDRIMVTAAPQLMPDDLVAQLAPGGVMVIPVGPSGWQQLIRVRRDSRGGLHMENLAEVAFVPMIGKYF
ncbi:MAG: protein-L-isoaspartate(D-aspartate) O-methyltransferase [Spirochaetae bacterium HGW-Spirochaetae-8]|nr:MAG: protein-L-isoaspartate(D-aspartate) O-methyltransferase [Spirochaetae bacterium HGW-Spirochaetae-8]